MTEPKFISRSFACTNCGKSAEDENGKIGTVDKLCRDSQCSRGPETHTHNIAALCVACGNLFGEKKLIVIYGSDVLIGVHKFEPCTIGICTRHGDRDCHRCEVDRYTAIHGWNNSFGQETI